jgi:hypothetical protein
LKDAKKSDRSTNLKGAIEMTRRDFVAKIVRDMLGDKADEALKEGSPVLDILMRFIHFGTVEQIEKCRPCIDEEVWEWVENPTERELGTSMTYAEFFPSRDCEDFSRVRAMTFKFAEDIRNLYILELEHRLGMETDWNKIKRA